MRPRRQCGTHTKMNYLYHEASTNAPSHDGHLHPVENYHPLGRAQYQGEI